jgi:NB-ARC domain
LERYRDELDENDDYNQILAESGSMQDVLTYAKSFETIWPRERATLNSLNRVGPMLKFVDDFSAIIAVCFGADAKLTAFVWGSIRLILNLASSAGDTLRDVLDMLEEVSLTLPRFRGYEQNLPMDKELENSLLNVYTEVICFYARAIQFFRSHPNILLRRNGWNDFQVDFGQTLKRIRRLSSTVESEADLARMRLETGKYREVLDLMKDLNDTKLDEGSTIIQCYHVPYNAFPQFCGREAALSAVGSALKHTDKRIGLKTFALYGMGGVGKTQIALQYAEQNRQSYDSILWLSTDTSIGLGQSVRDLVQALGLKKDDEELRDTFGLMLKLKNWLRERRKYLTLKISKLYDMT